MSNIAGLDVVCKISVPFVALLSPFFSADMAETKVSDDALEAMFSDMFKLRLDARPVVCDEGSMAREGD